MSDLSKGGAQGVFVNVMNFFSDNGYKVEIILENENDAIFKNDLSEKINIISLHCNSAKKALAGIIEYIKNNELDIAWAFTPELAINLLVARRLSKKDYKIYARNINTLSVELKQCNSISRKYITGLLLKMFYKNVDCIVAQSDGMKNDLIHNFGFKENRIKVINNTLSKMYEDEIDKETIMKKNNYILYAGRLEKQKGLEMLIEAFSQMKNKSSNLLIIGDGSEKFLLKELTKKKNLNNRIKFLDFEKNIIEYYKFASCFAMTSYFEGFPNVLIEACACGTPVVSYDLPSGPKEIIIKDVNGILVDYLNVHEFSNALDDALKRKWDYDAIKKTALRYTKRNTIYNYLDIMNE